MKNVSHLKALQALESAIRLGSIKNAAEDLFVTPAAVGQRIRTLEEYLGLQLLERDPKGAFPTPIAIKAIEDLSKGFRALENAAEKLEFQRLNEVHIQADPDWSELWLSPRLEAFHKENPSITIIVNSDAYSNSSESSFDFKISLTELKLDNQSCILFQEYFLPISSPLNYTRITELPDDNCLEGFPLLHLRNQIHSPKLYGWREWIQQFGRRTKVSGRGIQYERVSHAIQAVRSGNAGLLICGLSLVIDEIKAGSLKTPFKIKEGAWSGYAYQLNNNEQKLKRPQALIFKNWLSQEAKKTESTLKTICPLIE